MPLPCDPNLAVVAVHQRVRAALIALSLRVLLIVRILIEVGRRELISPIRPWAGGMRLEAVFVHLGIRIRTHDVFSSLR